MPLQHGEHLEATLHELSVLLAREPDQTKFAHSLLRYLHSIVPFTWGAIFLRIDMAHLRLLSTNQDRYAVHVPDNQPIRFQDFPLLRQVFLERQIIRVDDVQQEKRWRTPIPGYTARSWMGVPLVTRPVFALLSLASATPNFFTAEHQTLLETLAFPLALGLHNAMLQHNEKVARERLLELRQRALLDQEEERKRVSRELHDQAGQSLTAIMMNLELLQNDLSGQSQTLIDRTRASVAAARDAVHSIRSLVSQLRPPVLDVLGFDAAVEQLCQEYARQHRLEIQVHGAPVRMLPDPIALTLYRFIQEGLTNVVRHANASHVTIELTHHRDEFAVELRDDGSGFDVAKAIRTGTRGARFGLVGMRERLELVGGSMKIESEKGKGTRLRARVPLPPGISEREKTKPKGR